MQPSPPLPNVAAPRQMLSLVGPVGDDSPPPPEAARAVVPSSAPRGTLAADARASEVLEDAASDAGAPVNEAVGLLAQAAPARLSALQAAFAGTADASLLRVDLHLGDQTADRLRARVRIATEALQVAAQVCAAQVPALRARLRHAQQWQLAAQIVTAVSTATIFATAPKTVQAVWTYVAATCALLGALGGIVAQFLTTGLQQGGGALFTVYGQLVQLRFAAERDLRELAVVDPALEGDHEDIKRLVQSANGTAAEVTRLLATL